MSILCLPDSKSSKKLPTSTTTDEIIWSIMSIYAKKGNQLYLKFENHCMPLVEFISTIVPCLGKIKWPVDKEEISRVWERLVLMPQVLPSHFVGFALPPFTTSDRVKNVPLDRQLMFEGLSDDPSGEVSSFFSGNGSGVSGHRCSPTNEVRVSTFKTCWFVSTDAVVKRFRVTRDSAVTRIFLLREAFGIHSTRYHLTIFPHDHIYANNVRRRHDASMHCVATPTTKIWNTRVHQVASQTDLTAILWNVRGTVNSRFGKGFYNLITREKPKLIFITGTPHIGGTAQEAIESLGYTDNLAMVSDIGRCNGFYICWNRKELEVTTGPCYDNEKHITVMAASIPQAASVPEAPEKDSLQGKLLINPL